MPKTFVLVIIAAFAGLCALSASAYAKPIPNSSAVDQYTEAVPAAGGPKTSNGGGGTLPSGTAEALASHGKDGAAAAALAKATAPDSSGQDGSDTLGMGILLPAILIVALLGTVTAFVARRRRGAVPAG